MSNYVFPFQLVKKGAKVVLYGAGKVGQSFFKQLKTTEYADVVGWVDVNWENLRKSHFPVNDISTISECDYFDYVVIAVENFEIAEKIRRTLIEIGVEENKIIHSDKYKFLNLWMYKDFKEELEEITDFKKDMTQINPKKMLSSKRLDLIVRYLLAKDIINGVRNEENLSLYSRMILTRTSAYEGKSYFAEYPREGIKEYLDAFKKLCSSMKKDGFLQDRFIPVGENRVMLNGAHRTAAALALEEKIWVKRYENQNGTTDLGIEWFEKNGFNTEDKIRILRGYADLYDRCGIMLLFGTCMDQWDYLQAQLGKAMTIVGTVELDFSDNYIAFENLFREIYPDPLWRNLYLDRKVELLKMSPLKIRVLLVSDEGHKDDDLYKIMCNAKLELRNRMCFETDIAPIVMHGCDGVDEFEHLKRILLSVNNLKHLKMRVTRNYSEEFINRLDILKESLIEKNISIKDVCIAGSSSFEIFGLRKADDIDFFVKEKYRDKHGRITKPWKDNIEYTRINSMEISGEKVYADDLLIDDDNFHFVFYGLKFVNIDIVNQKKKYNARDKDKRDNRLYQLFQDYVMNFDDKLLLKMRIEDEFNKKR